MSPQLGLVGPFVPSSLTTPTSLHFVSRSISFSDNPNLFYLAPTSSLKLQWLLIKDQSDASIKDTAEVAAREILSSGIAAVRGIFSTVQVTQIPT